VALREAYLQNREAEIAALKAKDGEAAPIAAFDDPLADPAADRRHRPNRRLRLALLRLRPRRQARAPR
jgi:hypothetical protein